MAEFKAPYKNNTIKGIAGNADAYADYVTDEVGKAGVNALDNLVNTTYDVSEAAYNMGKNTVDTVGDFFTGEAQPNLPTGSRMPNANRQRLQRPTTESTGGTAGTTQPTQQGQSGTTTMQGGTRGAGTTQTTQTTQTNVQTPTFSSKEDVVYYLAQQPGWNNLSESERVARVEELWNTQNNQNAKTQDTSTAGSLGDGYAEDVMQNMQADLNPTSEETIYGKTLGGSSSSVSANQDATNVYDIAEQSRMNNVQEVLSMNPQAVAASLAGGDNAFSEQTIRDVKKYAPEFWNLVEAEKKKLDAGDMINAIASGESLPDTGKTSIDNVNNGVNSWAESISGSPQQTSYTIQNTQNAMNNNQIAQNATQLISGIDAEIEEYKSKISNLRKEANTVFKGDVPDYVVNAYINNRSQKYQAEIEKLEGRRQSALDLYKIELSNYQWGVEMDLKYKQFNQDISNENWDRRYKTQQLNKANVHWENGKAYQVNSDGTITQLTDATAYNSYMSDVNDGISTYKTRYTSSGGTKTATGYKYGYCGLECEGFTDNFTEMTTGLRMEGADGRGWTTAEEKMSYINSFIPEVGSVAVAVGGAYDSKYGHTMLVTGYDPSTGIVELLWSNKDGDKTVYSTTDTLANLQAKGLKGFWNPYKDLAIQSVAGNYAYEGFNTPMASAFERIASDSSLSATQRNALPIALEMYDTLYEIANNGQLNALVENGDLALIMKDLKNQKFSNADKGEKFVDAFSKALVNKAARLAGGDDSYAALMALQRVVEAKLRDESGAAISSSEWMTNFSYLLPQAGESAYVKNEKLKAWDRIISTKFVTAGGKLGEYIPIFQDSTVRKIRDY